MLSNKLRHVNPGQPVTAKQYNDLVDAIRSSAVTPSPNVRVTSTESGTYLGVNGKMGQKKTIEKPPYKMAKVLYGHPPIYRCAIYDKLGKESEGDADVMAMDGNVSCPIPPGTWLMVFPTSMVITRSMA